ncbi:MAG: hypothetical protein WBF17_06980 [Phycisphaerae bacterium]
MARKGKLTLVLGAILGMVAACCQSGCGSQKEDQKTEWDNMCDEIKRFKALPPAMTSSKVRNSDPKGLLGIR